jgi:hypothetical protein
MVHRAGQEDPMAPASESGAGDDPGPETTKKAPKRGRQQGDKLFVCPELDVAKNSWPEAHRLVAVQGIGDTEDGGMWFTRVNKSGPSSSKLPSTIGAYVLVLDPCVDAADLLQLACTLLNQVEHDVFAPGLCVSMIKQIFAQIEDAGKDLCKARSVTGGGTVAYSTMWGDPQENDYIENECKCSCHCCA